MWHILLIGFGSLLLLTLLASLSSYRRGRQIHNTVVAIHEEYTRREALLDDVRSGIYLSSLLVRDYLLDPSHITGDMHRQRLLSIRSSMTEALDKLAHLGSEQERDAIERLLPEMDAYWDTMDPIFEWTPGQKLAFSSLFLRRQVLPRRTAVLKTAVEIGALNEASFREQQEKVNRSIEDFRKYTIRTLSITVALGLLVSGASVLRLSRLEKRAEQAYLRTERAEQELRRLSQQLVQAQEEERRRISRELHDEVGQMLTGLRFELANLEAVHGGPAGEFGEHMKDAKDLAEKTLRAVRNIAMGLRPSLLDDLGLGPALEWQSREFSRRTGIPVELRVEGLSADLPDAHRTCVYRVIQEALTNCARHSRAKNIRVTVHAAPDLLSFAVQDNGIGFRPASRRWTGLGLTGVEERVRELGGSFEVHSQPGRGTSLEAEIPLPGKTAAIGAET